MERERRLANRCDEREALILVPSRHRRRLIHRACIHHRCVLLHRAVHMRRDLEHIIVDIGVGARHSSVSSM